MKLVVASGKGGTGKTTVAVNLMLTVASLPAQDRPAELIFLDCDVEEPNAHLFLNPELTDETTVGLRMPQVDVARCTGCGRCAEVCAFHAIAVINKKVLIFPELCHGCGSCTYNCPEGAIHEVLRPTGTISWGTVTTDGATVRFGQGLLNVSEAMATPIIRTLKQQLTATDPAAALEILDAPPGNACPVVETLRGADFALLVTEPTPFGLHDLRVAVDVTRKELGLPVGVVINRDGVGDEGVTRFCAEAGVPILLRIPQDRRVATAYAEGIPMVTAFPAYREAFRALYARLREEVSA
ncbi:MAG TPA: 4Fe-4S dicluster domain-containing protein [Chloroflexi bacterium]|nr:4Fe-4S dicluster domain-containing protein [Chloroflexota bacterium]